MIAYMHSPKHPLIGVQVKGIYNMLTKKKYKKVWKENKKVHNLEKSAFWWTHNLCR